MIGRIQGTLVSVHPPRLLVDCQGVGYEIDVPKSTLYKIPEVNQKITLLTHFQVREDAQQLFGFATETEREAFRALIKISGVGSRTALAVLSGMSVNELAQAIALQEAGRLTQVPGIGKKTAERLCLELKGKLLQTWALAMGNLKSSKRVAKFYKRYWLWAIPKKKRYWPSNKSQPTLPYPMVFGWA